MSTSVRGSITPGAATRALGLRLPSDATIIHDAVLALGDVYLEWRARDVVEVWDARLAIDKGMAIVREGKTLAIAPAYEVGEETRPVPLEVVSVAVLVILNGRTGSRPEWRTRTGGLGRGPPMVTQIDAR